MNHDRDELQLDQVYDKKIYWGRRGGGWFPENAWNGEGVGFGKNSFVGG